MELQFPSSAKLAATKKVGSGGGGEVWAAVHEDLGQVAVKVALQANDEFRKSLSTEYTLLRSLRHSTLISMFDFGCLDDGRSYIVMELCSGGDLYERCADLAVAQKLELFARVLTGFEYLHNVGLIHRDIKGENILIARDDTPRISDLGLAIASGSASEERSGTLEYMAPEVIQNEGASVESDVYSLAVVFYRVITGNLPFSGADPLQIIAAKQDVESIDWSDITGQISERTAEFLKKCLQPDRNNRTSSVRAFIDHLLGERLVQPDSIQAPNIRNYIHYHYRSFNYSFCKQELKAASGKIYLRDHLQNPESGLSDTVADFLKTELCRVQTNCDTLTIEFSRADGIDGIIQFQRTLGESTEDTVERHYPELDSTSLFSLTTKILRREPLDRYKAIIYEYSAGNLALLSQLLQTLQSQGYLDTRKLRLDLPEDAVDRFAPESNYWDRLSELVPSLDHDLEPVAAFLSCDSTNYPVRKLVEAELVDIADIKLLAEAGILDENDFRFKRPYVRLHVYHSLGDNQRWQYHAEWIAYLRSNADMDEVERLSCLFEHFVAARLSSEAITAVLKLAAVHTERQRFELAYEMLSRVHSLGAELSDVEAFLEYQIQLAAAAKKLGKIDESLGILSAVIRRASRTNDTRILADAYKRVGDVYKDKRQSERGLRALTKAIHFYEEEGNELELSHCFNNIGNLHCLAGDLISAETDFQRALTVQRRLAVERDIASTLTNLATVMAIQQKLDSAIRMYEEALPIKRRLDDRFEVARTLNNLGRANYEAGRMSEAREHLQEALDINLELRAESELFYNYDNLYELEERCGNSSQAFDWVLSGLRAVDRNDLNVRATFVCSLAEIMLTRGRYGKAATMLRIASRLAENVTDQTLKARLAKNFCDFYRVHRDFSSARAWLEKALTEAAKLGDPRELALIRSKAAQIELVAGGDKDGVEKHLAKAARLIADFPARWELLMMQLVHVHLRLEHDELEPAAIMLQNLGNFTEMDIFRPFQAEYLYCHAWLAFAGGDFGKTIEFALQALEITGQLQAPEFKWQILLLAGEAYRELAQHEKAMNAYISSFQTIQLLAEGITDHRLRELFLQDDAKLILTDRLQEMGDLVK